MPQKPRVSFADGGLTDTQLTDLENAESHAVNHQPVPVHGTIPGQTVGNQKFPGSLTDLENAESHAVNHQPVPVHGKIPGQKLKRFDTMQQLDLYETLEINTQLLTSGPSHHLWTKWKQLDKNGNGNLCRAEFVEVNKRLGVSWDKEAAWRSCIEIQTLQDLDKAMRWKVRDENLARGQYGDGPADGIPGLAYNASNPEISFRAFVSVYNQIMGTQRRRQRSHIKTTFEDLMQSPRGLHRSEVAKLVKRVEKRLLLLPPRFDIEKDWNMMLELSGIPVQALRDGRRRSVSRRRGSITLCDAADTALQASSAKSEMPDGEAEFDTNKHVVVDFIQFERWWKHRMGLIEADTPVLPEFFEYKMNEMSRAARAEAEHARRQLVQKLPPKFSLKVAGKVRTINTSEVVKSGFTRTRPGPDLWRLLRKRIRMLLTMRHDWGNIDDVYGHCESDFGQVDMPWYIRDPHSEFSAVWDLTQVVFLIYVSWTVPLRACFGLETELFSYVWLLDTVVDVYFLTDLGLNFATAYYDVNGVREGRVGFITKRYLKGWFSIDFVSCIPINYITMAMESSEDGDSNFRAFKVLRLFRLSKMLRLARIQRILQRYEELEFVQNYAGMGGLLFVIIIMAHILACVWYAIGLDDTHFHLGRQTPGWVLEELCAPACKLDIWDGNPPMCDTYNTTAECPSDRCIWGTDSDICPGGYPDCSTTDACIPKKLCEVGCEESSGVTLTWRYLTSMWYVFGSLDPKNRTLPERTFALLAYVVMVIIDGAVAGVLSSVMIRMGGKDAQVNEKLKAAKMWMREQRIPKDQASKALEYFRLVYKSRVMYEEADILNTMPPAMKLVFSTQLYEKFMREVPLFRGLPTSLIHSICSIVVPIQAVRGQVIYAEGTTGKEMYLLLSGELEITANEERLGFLSDGAFFGETPILDDASYAEVRRRTVTAMVDCKLCYLHKDGMLSMRERYPELALRLKRCARTETKVNKKGRKFIAAMAAASGGSFVDSATWANATSPSSATSLQAQSFLSNSSSLYPAGTAPPTAAGTVQMQKQLTEQASILQSMLATQQELVAAVERLEKGDATGGGDSVL